MTTDTFIVDAVFESYFKNRLKQVFLYITDCCQLHCKHCLYKTTLCERKMELQQTIRLLRLFKGYGAEKLTLIGGEPTLWGYEHNYRQFNTLLINARNMGYTFIRVDTNGQFDNTFPESVQNSLVNDLAFSLDGHIPEINDALRGTGTFDTSVKNIKMSQEHNFYTTITCCVHPGNIGHLEKMIQLSVDLGVKQINFHPMFKMGIDRDSFTGNTHIECKDWIKTYSDIIAIKNKGTYNIDIRISKRFVSRNEYYANRNKYDYCPQKLGERILIHPNGELRICALTIGSKQYLAKYDDVKIKWNTETSELEASNNEYFCNIQKDIFGDYIPLCISYKPQQNEYVWKKENFDSRFS